MKNRLVILGSGTCNLVPEKAAASVLIELNGMRLIYDFGRGIATRTTEVDLKQDDVEHIFISHFHPDHLSDLDPYLQAASWSQIDVRNKDINIYGPPGTKSFLKKMFAVFEWGKIGRDFAINIHDIKGGELSIMGQHLGVVDLHHSHGLRFGQYAIAGDADVNDDLIALLKGTKIAIFDSGHITDKEIVDIAVQTQAQTLVCSHQYRSLNEERLNIDAKTKGFKGQLVVAHDLMEFML